MRTNPKATRSWLWWGIGVAMLPVGAILWAWSQQPGDEELSDLLKTPGVASLIEAHWTLTGQSVDDLLAMSTAERAAACERAQLSLDEAAGAEIARLHAGATGSLAAACCWLVGFVSLLYVASPSPRTAAARKTNRSVEQVVEMDNECSTILLPAA